MILLIDNYDSFTYNLFQIIGSIDSDVKVFRNDHVNQSMIYELKPKKIVISPGPGHPKDAGNTIELIQNFHDSISILGICLGHQAIGYSFGASIIKAKSIEHGKVHKIDHFGHDIFLGVPNSFNATRYHSLIIDEKTLPKDFEIIAKTNDDTIMGISHKSYDIIGLQFHPESIGTNKGFKIIKNFLSR